MSAINLDQIIASPNLPTIPTVAMEILAQSQSDDVYAEKLASVVRNDPALTARLLRTVNSSYYRLAVPCTTVDRAVAYLGVNGVKSLVLGFSLVDWKKRFVAGVDLKKYWQRTLFTAVGARQAAQSAVSVDAEEAFTAGLLLDIGMMGLGYAVGKDYTTLVKKAGDDHACLAELEKAAFDFDHGEAGARLLEHWKLPKVFAHAARHHHRPNEATDNVEFVRTVTLGSEAAAALNPAVGSHALETLFAHAAAWFGMNQPQCEAMLEKIVNSSYELASILDLETDGIPSLNALLSKRDEIALDHQAQQMMETQRLEMKNAELTELALTDSLTNVGNRKQFDTMLFEQFMQARTYVNELAVLMIDVDRFKQINDIHGHATGDKVLEQVANRIVQTVADSGEVCRYGGEEFVVLISGSQQTNAAAVAESIRSAVADAPIKLEVGCGLTQNLDVTVSIGVACLASTTGPQASSASLLVMAADKAMYIAKAAGRNCVRVFSPPKRRISKAA